MTAFASEHGMSLYGALKEARQVTGLGKAAERILRIHRADGEFQGQGRI